MEYNLRCSVKKGDTFAKGGCCTQRPGMQKSHEGAELSSFGPEKQLSHDFYALSLLVVMGSVNLFYLRKITGMSSEKAYSRCQATRATVTSARMT